MTNRLWTSDEHVSAGFESDDQKKSAYRYYLSCIWDDAKAKITFIMLNPSIADLTYCDPTLQRCIKFTKSWGYGGFYAVNLFAYRATKPADLKKAIDPIGRENNRYILDYSKKGDKVIFAWGQAIKGKKLSSRVNKVRQLLHGIAPYYIALTKDGIPKHPLMLRRDLLPKKFII